MNQTELAHCYSVLCANSELRDEVKRALGRISSSPKYLNWKRTGLGLGKKFKVDHLVREARILNSIGLASGRNLNIVVNNIGRQIFITDGPWIDKKIRVFPFDDEAVLLQKYLVKNKVLKKHSVIVEIGTGCGHGILNVPKTKTRFAVEINPRALEYHTINQVLNNHHNSALALLRGDLRSGFPPSLSNLTEKRDVLLFGNLPFGPAPRNTNLGLTSDGGETGLVPLEHMMKVLRRQNWFSGSNKRTACFLTLSPGNVAEDRWLVKELADSYFPSRHSSWSMFKQQNLFRPSEGVTLNNPGDILEFSRLLSQVLAHFNVSEQQRVRRKYESIARTLKRSGFDKIGYGVLEISSDH